VWGDFEAGKNLAYGETLLKLQKRFVWLIAGKGGPVSCRPPTGPAQLRLHIWKFWNGRLPDGQMATLRRVVELHAYGTRSARSGLVVGFGNHRLVAYRVPAEWRTLRSRGVWDQWGL
jgi:hypothetical protein